MTHDERNDTAALSERQLSLEEELAEHEASLLALVTRQQALSSTLEATRTARETHVNHLDSLKLRRKVLEKARKKHLGLQQEIQEALEKSQERLARATAMTTTSTQDDGQPLLENAQESNAQVPVKEEEDSDEKMVSRDDDEAPRACENTIEIPRLHSSRDFLHDFWKCRHDAGFATFLPCLDSSLIQRIMDLTALETLALDTIHPEGDHRREALQKTCLDFFSTAAATAPEQAADHEEQALPSQAEKEDAIDPNVALCPYELTGECADVYCPYQHIKPRASSSQILARERLPLATLKLPELSKGGEQKSSRKRKREESADDGVQEDKGDSHQETGEEGRAAFMNESEQQQVDETPRDAGEETRVASNVSMQQDAKNSVAKQTDEERSVSSNVSMQQQEEGAEGSDEGQPTTLEWSNDFVSLPSVSRAPEEEDSVSDDGTGSEERTGAVPDYGVAQEDRKLWWLTEDAVSRIKDFEVSEGALRVSLIDWLKVVGDIQINLATDDNNISVVSEIVYNEHPTTLSQKISLVARIVDCMRLSIHAGRFDISSALCDYARMSFAEEASAEAGVEYLLRAVVKHMSMAREAALNFNSDSRSAFLCIFEAEVSLSVLAAFLRLLYTELASNPSKEWLCMWSDKLEAIFGLFREPPAVDLKATEMLQFDHEASTHGSCRFLKDLALDVGDDDGTADELVMARVRFHLETLHAAIRTGKAIMGLTANASMDLIVDKFLKPVLLDLRLLNREMGQEHSSGNHCRIQSALYRMGYLVLGCAEAACAGVFSRDELDVESSATLTAIESCIHQIVTAAAAIASNEPLAELLLTPLNALSVSLASTLRRYGKAQHRLEAALNGILTKRRTSLYGQDGYMIFSELLWSQLIQLRASLPLPSETGPEDSLKLSLSESVRDGHESLVNCVAALGVQPNHVTLCGDWNLLKPFRLNSEGSLPVELENIRNDCHALVPSLFPSAVRKPTGDKSPEDRPMSTSLSLSNFPLTLVRMTAMKVPSATSLAFPRSLLLAGQALVVLAADNCQLEELPATFGLYLPNLKVLKLSDNQLQELPASIGKLASLVELQVSKNRLKSLPGEIGNLRMLVRLDASHNELTALPSTIVTCKALEELDVSSNSNLQAIPSDLPLRLPALWKLSVDTDDAEETA